MGKEYWWCFKCGRMEEWMVATEDSLLECVRNLFPYGKVKVYGPFEELLPAVKKQGKWNHYATFEVWYGRIKLLSGARRAVEALPPQGKPQRRRGVGRKAGGEE